MEHGIFDWLGINLPALFAGLAGGVIKAFLTRKSDAYSICSSLVVGALTSMYAAEPISAYIGLMSVPLTALGIGLCAVWLCQSVIDAAQRWKPQFPNLKDSGGDK